MPKRSELPLAERTNHAYLHNLVFSGHFHICPDHEGWWKCTDVGCGTLPEAPLLCQMCFDWRDCGQHMEKLKEYYS